MASQIGHTLEVLVLPYKVQNKLLTSITFTLSFFPDPYDMNLRI